VCVVSVVFHFLPKCEDAENEYLKRGQIHRLKARLIVLEDMCWEKEWEKEWKEEWKEELIEAMKATTRRKKRKRKGTKKTMLKGPRLFY
jgi:hypothetical protein